MMDYRVPYGTHWSISWISCWVPRQLRESAFTHSRNADRESCQVFRAPFTLTEQGETSHHGVKVHCCCPRSGHTSRITLICVLVFIQLKFTRPRRHLPSQTSRVCQAHPLSISILAETDETRSDQKNIHRYITILGKLVRQTGILRLYCQLAAVLLKSH